MLTYIVFYLLSLFCLYQKRNVKSKELRSFLSTAAILCLVTLATFRDTSIGTDYKFYVVPTYNMAGRYTKFLDFAIANGINVEFGFNLLSWVSAHVVGDVRFSVFVMSLITNTFVYLGIQHFKNRCSETFAWFVHSFLFFPITLNIMRQSIVVSACFYLLTKKNVKTKGIIISTLLCLSIHNSAIMIIALYIIKNLISIEENQRKRWYKKAVFVLLLFLPLILNTLVNVFFSYVIPMGGGGGIPVKYLIYRNSSGNISIGNILFRSLYSISIFLLYYLRNKRNRDLRFLIYTAFMDIFFLLSNGIFQARLAIYFTIFEVLYIPAGLRLYSNRNYSRIIMGCSIVLVVLVSWYYHFTILGEGEIMPYKFWTGRM